MLDNRPQQLIDKVKETVDENDSVISDALDKLQEHVFAGHEKPTMINLRKYCDLSEGAIRCRPWALKRLKALKSTLKVNQVNQPQEIKPKSELQLLKARIRDLLKENAILFDEVIGLNELVDRKDRENEALLKRLNIKSSNTTKSK